MNVQADGASVDEVVRRLREQEKVPVEVGAGAVPGNRHMTLRLPGVRVGAVLAAMAVALGPEFRWRRTGERWVLERETARQWHEAAPGELAGELRRSLEWAGLLGPALGAGGGPNAANRPSPAELPAMRVAEDVRRLVPADTLALSERTGQGIPVAALPRPLQEQIHALFVKQKYRNARSSAVGAAQALVVNPVVSGVAPEVISMENQGGRWVVFYRTKPGERLGFDLLDPTF